LSYATCDPFYLRTNLRAADSQTDVLTIEFVRGSKSDAIGGDHTWSSACVYARITRRFTHLGDQHISWLGDVRTKLRSLRFIDVTAGCREVSGPNVSDEYERDALIAIIGNLQAAAERPDDER